MTNHFWINTYIIALIYAKTIHSTNQPPLNGII